MSGNLVSFLRRHLFTCPSNSLFCSRKDAVPCGHDPVSHTGWSASPKHNDSSDSARSPTKKLQPHIALPFTAIYLPCPPYTKVFAFAHLPSRETRQTNAGVMQLWKHAYVAASLLPFLLQRISNPISSSLVPQGQAFSQSMATACCQSQLPSRVTSAFSQLAPPCQLQWETLSLH